MMYFYECFSPGCQGETLLPFAGNKNVQCNASIAGIMNVFGCVPVSGRDVHHIVLSALIQYPFGLNCGEIE